MSDSETIHTTKQDKTPVNLTQLSKASREKYRSQANKLFEKDFGYRAVASMLRISDYTVRNWVRLYKIGAFEPKIKPRGNSPQNYSLKVLRDLIRDEYENRESITSLSMKYGKNKSTVRYWLRKKHEKI